MKRSSSILPRRGPSGWTILGWFLLVILGIGLIWVGFTQPFGAEEKQDPAATSQAGSTAPTPTPTEALYPTFTPLPTIATPTPSPAPTNTPNPTPVPQTPTSIPPSLVAGADGVNFRAGPSTRYTLMDYLNPGAEAEITGRHDDWWQIRYKGTLGWVFGDLVTASNTDNVPQVEPPPAPTAPSATAIPPTAAPTAVPPTSAPPSDFRGLVADDYQVEGAPGPYGVGADIWFNMWITNKTSSPVEYKALGTLVEETGQFQKSYTYSEFKANAKFNWRDHINIPNAGSYNLWLTICFRDDECFRMLGPVPVTVQ